MTRLATLLLGIPIAFATGAGTAGATTVPGCYGASTAIVCNPSADVGLPYGVETYEMTVPVCAGTCQDVPVTLVRTKPGQSYLVCTSYEDAAHVAHPSCVTTDAVATLAGEVVAVVVQTKNDFCSNNPCTVPAIRQAVNDFVEYVTYQICSLNNSC
jgi:hypothetical protein